MLYKVLRKLKLGKGAYALLYPFRGKADILPGTEEARALLEGVSPDAGGSCLCDRRVNPHPMPNVTCVSAWMLCLGRLRGTVSACS